MRLQPQLYVDTSGNPLGEPTFEIVDFFDFESIELTSTVQDFRDISKVFTDYSKTFNLPASKTNNRIFKHYYNASIVNGFDARIKQRAEIHINGILFKVGYLRLSKSLVSSGKPTSYSVTFFGSLTNLSNVIGDSKLSDLSTLDKYNHEYDKDTVYDGFTGGLQLEGDEMSSNVNNRDIVYPAISATDKWYYDPSTVEDPVEYNQGFSVNLYNQDKDGAQGINYLSLKPAIKARHIITAIQEKYSSINFSDDFFGSAEFDNLYMLLHNNKGRLAPNTDSTEYVSKTYRIGTNNTNSDFRVATGTDIRDAIITKWGIPTGINPSGNRDVFQYQVIVTIENTVKSGGGGDPVYDVDVLDGNTAIERFIGVSGDNDLTAVLCTDNERKWEDVRVRISSRENELISYEMSLELKFLRYRAPYDGLDNTCDVNNSSITPVTESYFYNTAVSGTQSLIQLIEITRNIPKMKIIDFLTGIFKMFNLTALPQNDGSLKVQPLNQFYDEGNTIDITSKVNTEEVNVNRMDLFKNMNFKFSDPKTFGIINYNEKLDEDYGDLEYQASADGTDSSLIFDGKDYKVELPFEKLYYERLSCPASSGTTALTEFGHGWLADKDQNEVLTKPILFYNIVQTIDDDRTASNGAELGVFGFLNYGGNITQYNRPSNTNASQVYDNGSFVTNQGDKSINFNREIDEYTYTPVSRGLFRKYYQSYISNIFNKGTRVFNLDMKADLGFLLKYKINDTLTIKGEEFLINNIRTNLTTGLTKLELVLKFFIEIEDETSSGFIPSIVTGLRESAKTASTIILNWNANPIDEIIKGYNLYDGSGTLIASTNTVENEYVLTGLDSGTTYTFKIKARNASGESADFSTPILSVTTEAGDTTPPSSPRDLSIGNIDPEFNKVTINWVASSPDPAYGYELYRDGVSQGTTTSLSFDMDFVYGVRYEVSVKAYDLAGNYSAPAVFQVRISIP
jgi:chitodextrinase